MRTGDNIPSRTPEGDRLHCDLCDRTVRLEVSLLSEDATCPFCGGLLWKKKEPAKELVSRIEETRGKIGGLVGEMAELSRSADSLPVLLEGFSSRLVSAMAAFGAVIWEIAPDGSPVVMVKAGAPPDASLEPSHLSLLSAAQDDAWMVMPEANPTRLLLLFAPVPRAIGPPLLLEVVQRPNTNSLTQRGYRRFVQQASEFCESDGSSKIIGSRESGGSSQAIAE
jgi:hypothetical protein